MVSWALQHYRVEIISNGNWIGVVRSIVSNAAGKWSKMKTSEMGKNDSMEDLADLY